MQYTPTILLVEDDELVMEMTRNLLEVNGYRVISTYLPEKAIEYVRNRVGTIDLLLSDVIMPQMNGPEMLAKIHHVKPELPALFMSGYASEVIGNTEVCAKRLFIQKPFRSSQLIACIQSMLG